MQPDKPEKCDRVLIISGSAKAAEALRATLTNGRFAPHAPCADALEARTRLAETPFPFVVINAPLPDAAGPALAGELAKDPSRGVLLLVSHDEYDRACAELERLGVLTLPKPCPPWLPLTALNLLAATRARLSDMAQKTQSLEMKMQDIRLINRAKWVLIEQLKMDEAAAHHYIEKQAMNQHRTRREVAQSILMTYEY